MSARAAVKFCFLLGKTGTETLEILKTAYKGDALGKTQVITGDESWCYGYDPETKQQSSQWKTPASPRPKKARQVRSNIKTMLICFFDVRGVVHSEFVPPGQTVNQAFYLEVLKRLRNSLRRKRPDLWQSGDWFFHHDNAPAHTALSVRRFLTKNDMTTVSHPPYSPDLSPCDFFLFPRMKRNMKGKRFADIDERPGSTCILCFLCSSVPAVFFPLRDGSILRDTNYFCMDSNAYGRASDPTVLTSFGRRHAD
ncbi:Transposase, type 1 [Cinara cedri]|uniref:Transposase, type 1 n=1 Tax=Cinara cedri TaxID=506608 RepID=A0A5E4MX80_9HEMI|nr:Transposase, type 1 [Cinara cedri]